MKKRILFAMLSVLALASCGEAGPSSSDQASSPSATTSAGGQTSGGQTSGGQTSGGQSSVMDEAYQIYRLYLASGGNMTYEEWLASIKGAPGASLLSGSGDPVASLGNNGDSYVNTSTWDVFVKTGGAWTKVGNIMGPKGQDGRDAYSCTILPSEHGYVSVSVGSAFVGEDVTFIAYPEKGFVLAHLYLNEVDVIEQVADKVHYTTKMVKNGFVVRAVFEINRRVSDEVFKREIKEYNFLKEKSGFSMRYTTKITNGSYSSGSSIELKKSGNVISMVTGDASSNSETLVVGNNDKEDCDSWKVYGRSCYSGEHTEWTVNTNEITFRELWNTATPGFLAFSQLEYTYNPNTGYYETYKESLDITDGMGMGIVSDLHVLLGFFDDRLTEIEFTCAQSNVAIGVKGTLFDYDGKTTIDPKYVEDAIEEATRKNVSIWVPSSEVSLTQSLLEDFTKAHPEYQFKYTVSGHDTYDLFNYSDSGDVFYFAQDQLNRLIANKMLDPLGSEAKARVSKANTPVSIEGAMWNETVYGYPTTADNGYFMYYNKAYVNPSHATSLSAILSDCEASNRYFLFEGNSAWYTASFFLGAGCHSNWSVDADGQFVSVDDNYYSPEGIVALKGLSQILTSDAYANANYSYEDKSAVLISGTWRYQDLKKYWGDNLVCAELPKFTVDGKSYHMGSFLGCKYIGVKPQQDEGMATLCHAIADYLSSYEAQLKRAEQLGYGPSNLDVAKSKVVQDNPALKAFNAQLQYTTLQGQFPDSWWDIAGTTLSRSVSYLGSNPSNSDLQDILYGYNTAVNQIAHNTAPTPSFPDGGGQEDQYPMPESGYGLLIGNNPVVATELEEADYQGRTQYAIRGQEFNEGDSFVLYDFGNMVGWTIEIDSYSFGAQGVASAVENYVVRGSDAYYAVKDFVADIYIKLKQGDDQIYFQLAK